MVVSSNLAGRQQVAPPGALISGGFLPFYFYELGSSLPRWQVFDLNEEPLISFLGLIV